METKTAEQVQVVPQRHRAIGKDLAERRAAARRLRALQAELAATHGKFEDSVKVLAKTRERSDGK